MGTWGFDTFKKYLKFRNGNRSDVESYEGTNLYETWTNEAYVSLTTRKQIFQLRLNLRFPELEVIDAGTATVAGTPSIAVASGAVQVMDVFDSTNKLTLGYITPRKYLSYADRLTVSARNKPTEWARFGGYLYLHPTPDGAYTIYQTVRKSPTLLTGSAATVIGTEWDEPILELATYKSFLWMKEFDSTKAVKEEFLDMVAGIIGMYEAEEISRQDQIHPAPTLREPGRR